MSRSWQHIDRAAEERPWLTGLAAGVPAGIVLAIVLAAFGDGEAFDDPMRLLGTGVVQGLIIAVLVASGGTFRGRMKRDPERSSGSAGEPGTNPDADADPDADPDA